MGGSIEHQKPEGPEGTRGMQEAPGGPEAGGKTRGGRCSGREGPQGPNTRGEAGVG
jgi:hypothetical protein